MKTKKQNKGMQEEKERLREIVHQASSRLCEIHNEERPPRRHGWLPCYYSDKKTKTMNKPVYVNCYTLMVADSWESGSAYSIHLTEKASRKFKTDRYWAPSCSHETAEPAFVSPRTLEKILRTKEKFIFQENMD